MFSGVLVQLLVGYYDNFILRFHLDVVGVSIYLEFMLV